MYTSKQNCVLHMHNYTVTMKNGVVTCAMEYVSFLTLQIIQRINVASSCQIIHILYQIANRGKIFWNCHALGRVGQPPFCTCIGHCKYTFSIRKEFQVVQIYRQFADNFFHLFTASIDSSTRNFAGECHMKLHSHCTTGRKSRYCHAFGIHIVSLCKIFSG